MMEILTRLSDSRNYSRGRAMPVSYLVIHYTGNKGDTGKNNADCFATGVRQASAHYFVDENEVWRSVPEEDTAWHCGGAARLHGDCRNSNSIGVEICMWDKSGNVRQDSINHAAALCRELMHKYEIDAGHVLRHYDVTGKRCPAPFVANPGLWAAFRTRLEESELTENEVRALINEALSEKVYNTLEELPDWARPTVEKLLDAKALEGTDTGLGLSYDLLRTLVVNGRMGLYGPISEEGGIHA